MKKLLFLIFIISINSKAQTLCNGVFFMSGSSVYSTGGYFFSYPENCLTYNKDLNTVSWIHRASPYFGLTYNAAKSSVQTTWLDLNTNIWDSMMIYVGQPNLARYPGGTIFNPSGNNLISNAYMLGIGSALDAAGTNWVGTWYSSRQPSGSYHSITSALNNNSYADSGTPPFGSVCANDNTGSPNADMQQVYNTVFSAGNLIDINIASNDGYGDQSSAKGGVIAKATYTGSGFNWTSDSIIPNFYQGTLGYANYEKMRLAFSPDRQTGYAVFIGRLATNFGNNSDSTLSPIIYKTIDAGNTWSSAPILPGFDWKIEHPELMKNVGCLTTNSTQYMLTNVHGIDVTVDSTNTLHLVGVVTNPINNIDSMAVYSNLYKWDYTVHHPIIWDLMTDGSTWNTILVDSIKTAEISQSDTSGYLSNWTNLAYGARIQVSRSITGGKIFYSWADSDSSLTHSLVNLNPNIYMKSYDISNQMLTPTTAITDTGICYFHFLSDVSYYDNTSNSWVCPLVYTTDSSTTLPYTGNVVRYNYINCAEFSSSQYTDSASVYRAAGASSGISKSKNLNNSVNQNYPNPFNENTYITVNLIQSNSIDLKIYNTLGALIYSKNTQGSQGENVLVVSGSNLESGVYYYTVTIGDEKITKKMIVQK